MVTLPFGFGRGAIHGFRPIELEGTLGNRAVIDVEDVSIAIGVNCIEHGNRDRRHGFLEFVEVVGLAHGIPLVHLPAFFELGHFHGQEFAVALGQDGSVVSFAEGERAIGKSTGSLDLDGFFPFGGMPVFAVVPIGERVTGIVEGFLVDVDDIRLIHGVAPSKDIIVADGGETRTEEGCAAHVPAFLAMDVAFIPLADTEEGLMRIDEKHGMAVRALGRSNGPHVRALRFDDG